MEDELVRVIPIRYVNTHHSKLQLHQFPLLHRPLESPPSAQQSGKRILARTKPKAHRLEVHIPSDTRPEIWNEDRGRMLGAAQAEDDRENSQSLTAASRLSDDSLLRETRMRSEEVLQRGAHMMGLMKNGACLSPQVARHDLIRRDRYTALTSDLTNTPIPTNHDIPGSFIQERKTFAARWCPWLGVRI